MKNKKNMNRVLFDETPMLKEFRDFLLSDKCPQTEYPIHIRPFETENNHIFFQIEQIPDDDTNINYEILKRDNIKEIWTFSNFNIKKMKENGITNCRYIEIKPTDEYYQKIMAFNLENTYEWDVCFVGWMSDRRWRIVEGLMAGGAKVNVINIVCDTYGDVRDNMIAKSKILLNVHYSDGWNCFEQIRCFPWINTGKIVVSEDSYDKDDRVIFAEYDKLVDTVLEVLKTKF